MITRTSGSSVNACRTSGIDCHISSETALCRAGLLKIIQPTGPSLRATSFSVSVGTVAAPTFMMWTPDDSFGDD